MWTHNTPTSQGTRSHPVPKPPMWTLTKVDLPVTDPGQVGPEAPRVIFPRRRLPLHGQAPYYALTQRLANRHQSQKHHSRPLPAVSGSEPTLPVVSRSPQPPANPNETMLSLSKHTTPRPIPAAKESKEARQARLRSLRRTAPLYPRESGTPEAHTPPLAELQSSVLSQQSLKPASVRAKDTWQRLMLDYNPNDHADRSPTCALRRSRSMERGCEEGPSHSALLPDTTFAQDQWLSYSCTHFVVDADPCTDPTRALLLSHAARHLHHRGLVPVSDHTDHWKLHTPAKIPRILPASKWAGPGAQGVVLLRPVALIQQGTLWSGLRPSSLHGLEQVVVKLSDLHLVPLIARAREQTGGVSYDQNGRVIPTPVPPASVRGRAVDTRLRVAGAGDRPDHEALVLARLQGLPGVVEMRDCVELPTRVLAVTLKLYPNGDVFEFLQSTQRRNGVLPIQAVRTLMASLLQTMSLVHGRGVAHLDLCAENILLDQAGLPIVSDFGSCVYLPNRGTKTTKFGTNRYEYAAPETRYGDVRDGFDPFAADVWALACLLYLLLSGDQLYTREDSSSLRLMQRGTPKQVAERILTTRSAVNQSNGCPAPMTGPQVTKDLLYLMPMLQAMLCEKPEDRSSVRRAADWFR